MAGRPLSEFGFAPSVAVAVAVTIDAESWNGRLLRSSSHECLGSAFLNQVSILIQDFPVPGDDASSSFGLRLQ